MPTTPGWHQQILSRTGILPQSLRCLYPQEQKSKTQETQMVTERLSEKTAVRSLRFQSQVCQSINGISYRWQLEQYQSKQSKNCVFELQH